MRKSFGMKVAVLGVVAAFAAMGVMSPAAWAVEPGEARTAIEPRDAVDSDDVPAIVDSVVATNCIESGDEGEEDVNCMTVEGEVGDATEDPMEEEAEPEMWPMYVSLGALGGTVLIVIIINIAARARKNR